MALDKRAKRTQNWLYEALINLMEQKNYREITITELAEKADIARPTFYHNYNSIDDILINRMDEAFGQYIDSVRKDLKKNLGDVDRTMDAIVRQIFVVWQGNEKLFRLLVKAGLTHKMVERFNDYVTTLQSEAVPEFHSSVMPQRYLTQFFAAGTVQFLTVWIEEGMVLSVDEAGKIYKPMMKLLIETSRKYNEG